MALKGGGYRTGTACGSSYLTTYSTATCNVTAVTHDENAVGLAEAY